MGSVTSQRCMGPIFIYGSCLGDEPFQAAEQDRAQKGIFVERLVIWGTMSVCSHASISSTLLSGRHS